MDRDIYSGVREASKYLKESGVARKERKKVLDSFEKTTIKMQTAGSNCFGLRFSSQGTKGKYLFETFTDLTNRSNLALPYEWNTMSYLHQYQIKEGTTIISGKAAPQLQEGSQYVGGIHQWYVEDLEALF